MRLVLLTLFASLLSLAAPLTLDETLARVHRNVDVFENQLPDFVCNETITSRTIEEAGNKIEKEAVIVSAFTGRQKRASSFKLITTNFTEERQIQTVNGAAWPDRNMPKGYFLFGGGYSSTLARVFGSNGKGGYSYALEPGTGSTVVISFATTDDRHKAKSKSGLESFRETGRATFDAASLQITRLESVITGKDGGELPLAIDFNLVQIGDATFQMPSKIKVTAHHNSAGKAERGEYEAVYTNYRKYGSSTSVQFQDPAK